MHSQLDPALEPIDGPGAPDDETCMARVRAGDRTAFGILYRRHHPMAVRAAAAIAGRELAEEHTAEAFARTYELLRQGKGPQQYFRAYVITAIRNNHYTYSKRAARHQLHSEPLDLVPPDLSGQVWDDLFAGTTVAAAFASLPERWRTVLWLQTVEGCTLSEISVRVGISKGATAQLSFRAREALRLAYLAAHALPASDATCAPILDQLPRHVRGNGRGGPAATAKVVLHLASCPSCDAAATDLSEVAAAFA